MRMFIEFRDSGSAGSSSAVSSSADSISVELSSANSDSSSAESSLTNSSSTDPSSAVSSQVQQTWSPRNRVQKTRVQVPKLSKSTSSEIQVQCSGSAKMGFWALRGARRRSVGSRGAQNSSMRVRDAVCTVATGVFGTSPKPQIAPDAESIGRAEAPPGR